MAVEGTLLAVAAEALNGHAIFFHISILFRVIIMFCIDLRDFPQSPHDFGV
jgi:hypothetical protein